MSVEKLKKIEIVALKRIKSELLEILQHQGIIHITSIRDAMSQNSLFSEPTDQSLQFEDNGWLGQLEYLINYLKRFDPFPKGLLESLMEPPIKISREEIQSLLSNFDLEMTLKTCKEMDKTAQSLEAEGQEIHRKLEELANWQALDATLKDATEGTKFIDFYTVLIPTDQIVSFKKGLESSCSAVVDEIQDMTTYKSFLIMAFKTDRQQVEEQINHYGVQMVALPLADETPEQLNQRLRSRLEEIKNEKTGLQEKGENLLDEMNKLKILFDYYRNQELKREVQERFAFTDQTIMITGWIMEKDLPRLEQAIHHLREGLDLEILDPQKDEAPPVTLSNNPVVSPFVLVTRLYDLPHYKELDPTPILAPFFFLFFGLCVTDLGYGILIAAVTLWGLKYLYLKEGGNNLLRLFFLCGISTMICGTLAGSWFGDIVTYLPAWLGFLNSVKNTLAIIDPIKDPLKFLILSLTLGYIQVVTGILVQMYKDIKAGEYFVAFLVRVPWVCLLTSLILFVIAKGKIAVLFKWVALLSALTICLCEGGKERNILKRLGTGLIALYGTVGYYADMLSYCRLLALGLATAVIATVVNQMAILSRGIPYIGIVFMFAILVVGHLFNLIINSLGAFVHTSRLQFVEFFTKFFEGGGKAFVPFARQNRYTIFK